MYQVLMKTARGLLQDVSRLERALAELKAPLDNRGGARLLVEAEDARERLAEAAAFLPPARTPGVAQGASGPPRPAEPAPSPRRLA